jgi:AAA domain
VLLLNLDLPNATRYAHSRAPDGRLMEAKFEGMSTLVDVHEALYQQPRMVDTVVVDPIGELHRRLLDEFSGRAVRPTLNQYGDVATHVERFCRMLCEAPVNVVLVCHEQPVKDEASGQMEKLPWTGTTNPSLGQKLMGMVDVIGYTGVVEQESGPPEYVAQLVNSGGRRGGDRFDVLGSWRRLDLADWFRTINGNQTTDEKKEAVAA